VARGSGILIITTLPTISKEEYMDAASSASRV